MVKTARSYIGKSEFKAGRWLGTLNNPDVALARDYLELWHTKGGARYVNGQVEKGEQGTVHVQFFLNFENPVRISALKKHCVRAHFEPVKVDNGASSYAMKEETRVDGPWEFGIKPVKRNSKEDWEEVRKLAIQGKMDKIPADIFVKHYQNLRAIKKDYMDIERDGPVDARWYWGQSGAGKSRKAWEEFPSAYPKQVNLWWDGYRDQEAVIIDDLDKFNVALGGDIKRWADRYKVIGQIKGGAVPLNFKTLIITSQYSPEQIWEDEKTVEAIKRRFKVVKFENVFE